MFLFEFEISISVDKDVVAPNKVINIPCNVESFNDVRSVLMSRNDRIPFRPLVKLSQFLRYRSPDFGILCLSAGFVSSNIYDKRHDFDLDIVNFSFGDGDILRATSYGDFFYLSCLGQSV